jgi:hypothetical protein
MRAIERAWDRAYPGREAAARDDVLRELRRLLDARVRAAPARADPTAPGSATSGIHCGVRAVLLVNALRLL